MTSSPIQLAVLTGCRSDYGLLLPLLRLLKKEQRCALTVYATAGHLSEKMGMTVRQVESDGFAPIHLAPLDDADDSPMGMAALAGRVTESLANLWQRDKPDWLVVLGDRVEVLAAAVAAWNARVPLAQLQPGDLSLVDDAPRHAVSRLASLLFPATQDAQERLLAWGEEPWRVKQVGSLSVDNALSHAPLSQSELAQLGGETGLDLTGDFLILLYHPIPGEAAATQAGLEACLAAVDSTNLPTLAVYPNADAGGAEVIAQLNDWAANGSQRAVVKNLPPREFIGLLGLCRALVGNSSAGIIECSALGTPVVNVGPRQGERERGENVFDAANSAGASTALGKILADEDLRERLKTSPSPYGNGKAAEQIRDLLLSTTVDSRLLNKRLVTP